MKRVLAFCMAVVMICACGVNAFAATETIDPVRVAPVSVINPASRVATFGFNFELGLNQYTAVATAFTLDGTEELGFNITWTPANQEIKVALRNIHTNHFYTLHIEYGSVNAVWDLSETGVAAGTYEVCVINPLDSIGTVSGSASFYWR